MGETKYVTTKKKVQDFPAGPVVKNLLPCPVRYLVRELDPSMMQLRIHMLQLKIPSCGNQERRAHVPQLGPYP